MEIIISDSIRILSSSGEIIQDHQGIPKIVKVEPIPMRLLVYLAERGNQVCSTQELINHIWEGNEAVGKPALRKRIYQLRIALSELGGNDLIETIPKKGYRLNRTNSILPRTNLNNRKRILNLFYSVAGIILFLIVIKLMYPGIFHTLAHRLNH